MLRATLCIAVAVALTSAQKLNEDQWITTSVSISGKCGDDADQAAWKKHEGSFKDDMTTCGKQCLGKADCVTTCIEKADGYGADCAGCFGDLAGCTAKHCMLQCINGNSPSCTSCVEKAGCNTDFTTCSGLTPSTALVHELEDESHEAYVHRMVYGWDMSAASLKAPSGTYTGTKSELGADVKATITIDDASHADIDVEVTGITTISVKCPKEDYTLSGTSVNLPNQNKPGDCLHDHLQKDSASINSVTYDSASDSITISVHKVLNIEVKLTK